MAKAECCDSLSHFRLKVHDISEGSELSIKVTNESFFQKQTRRVRLRREYCILRLCNIQTDQVLTRNSILFQQSK